MKINRIQLRNYRNYENIEVSTLQDKLFFLGNNAQGKTNLLEAIYYASTMRSFRTNDDLELIQFDQDFAKLVIGFERNQLPCELEIVISRTGKYVLYQGQVMTKMSDVIGQLNAVVFSPLDLKLLFGSPRDRRKFMDMELGKISPSYLHDLLLAQKILKERNAYLKSQKIDDMYLDVLTKQLIEVQLRLMKARSVFLQLLEDNARIIYQAITQENEILTLRYLPCTSLDNEAVMRLALQDAYEKQMVKDKEFRTTNIGFHREDFELYLGNHEVHLFGSQGQRRSCALALKIGLLEVIRKRINEYPVLLLDDVLSELDENHRIKLFEVIPASVQLFLSGTELQANEKQRLNQGCFYQVHLGNITKEE